MEVFSVTAIMTAANVGDACMYTGDIVAGTMRFFVPMIISYYLLKMLVGTRHLDQQGVREVLRHFRTPIRIVCCGWAVLIVNYLIVQFNYYLRYGVDGTLSETATVMATCIILKTTLLQIVLNLYFVHIWIEEGFNSLIDFFERQRKAADSGTDSHPRPQQKLNFAECHLVATTVI